MNEAARAGRRMLANRADRWLWNCWALLAIPVLWWLVRVLRTDWIPHGDLAVATIKIHDVFSADPPLLGMPTTSSLTVAGNSAHHPGAFQFYVLAVGYRLSGGWPGSLLIGSAALVLVFAWLALRAGRDAWGMRGLLIVLIALVQSLLGMGLHAVVPWNPWPASIAAIAAFAAAWAILRGQQQWWVGFVAASAMAAQSHLSFGPLMLGIGIVLAVVTTVEVRRHGMVVHDRRSWTVGSILLAVLWAPPVVDQLVRDEGNLTKILEYSGGSGGGTPWILYGLGVAAVLGLLSLRGITLTSGRPESLLPLLAIAWALAEWSTGRSAEGSGAASYASTAWLFFVAWWLAIPLLKVARRWPQYTWACAMVVALLVAVKIAAIPWAMNYDDARAHSAVAREVVTSAEDLVGQFRIDLPIEVRTHGGTAWAGVGPAVCAQFVRDGLDVYCGDGWTLGREGDQRHSRHLTGARLVVLVSSGTGPTGDLRPTSDVVWVDEVQDELGLSNEREDDWITVAVFEENPES